MPDHVTDHERDRAIGQWDGIEPVTPSRLLLPSGQVLVAGGATSSDTFSTASAELYDPATGLFRATGAMATDRVYHTATLLPSRQVLVAGGDGAGGNSLASAELYTPPNLLTVGASTVGPASKTRFQRSR